MADIGPQRLAVRVTERAVNPRATVTVDGIETQAYEIDTDPFVYAIGVQLDAFTCVTAVVPRAELEYVDIGFEQRATPRLR